MRESTSAFAAKGLEETSGEGDVLCLEEGVVTWADPCFLNGYMSLSISYVSKCLYCKSALQFYKTIFSHVFSFANMEDSRESLFKNVQDTQ